MQLKIGELATRAGLTVRTLHHYDAIGLLKPSGRSESGYRLYDRNDVARLHRIQALRRLDLSLAEIGNLLAGGGADLQSLIAQQITALDRQMARSRELRARLAELSTRIGAHEEPDLDEWLSTLSLMQFHDRYFTPEEQSRLRQALAEDDGAFDALKGIMRSLMQAGVPPHSPDVLPHARRWIELSLRSLAGDARLMHKIDQLHRQERAVPDFTGIDTALLDYVTRATAEYRLSLYARHIAPEHLDPVRPRFHRHYLQWPALFAQARDLAEQGTAVDAPQALDLARRWMELFVAVWGSDPDMRQRVLRANELEPELMGGLGLEDAGMRLMRASMDILKNRQK